MAFLGDYHTHTQYSRRKNRLHAKGSVLQNVQAAAAAGLKEIAVTDHGFNHYYGVKGKESFDALKQECKDAEKSTGVKVYVGLEHNLDPCCAKSSEIMPFIGCDKKLISELEIIQGGYHAFIGTPKYINNMLFWLRNVVFKFLPGRKKLIARNTAAYKRMIDEYDVDFIGHLNRGILADAVEVAKYAHERGVYIELNGRHKSLKRKEIKAMVEAGVEFICNSDAHCPEDVGKMTYGIKMIEECGIPYEQIANWERLPEFRSQSFKNARADKLDKQARGGGDVDD